MDLRTRVLIVDDEVALADTLALQLEHEGFGVDTAHNGADALRLLRTNDYDAVVCDVLMPIMDGERLYEQVLTERPRFASRFIFMSATSTMLASATQRFVRSTSLDLHKPFSESQLLASLSRIIPPMRWPKPPASRSQDAATKKL